MVPAMLSFIPVGAVAAAAIAATVPVMIALQSGLAAVCLVGVAA